MYILYLCVCIKLVCNYFVIDLIIALVSLRCVLFMIYYNIIDFFFCILFFFCFLFAFRFALCICNYYNNNYPLLAFNNRYASVIAYRTRLSPHNNFNLFISLSLSLYRMPFEIVLKNESCVNFYICIYGLFIRPIIRLPH